MPALQVKDCPNEVYDRLRICAAEENRSISQQALTIIEDYLNARDRGEFAGAASNDKQPRIRARAMYSNTELTDGVDYAKRREEAFARIRQLPPIPVSASRPRADVLLAQIRKEEAR